MFIVVISVINKTRWWK